MPRKKTTTAIPDPVQPTASAAPAGSVVEPSTAAAPPDHDAPAAGESAHATAVRPDGPRAPNPFGSRQDAVAGVRLLEDRRYKQVQLKFADKPSAEVREAVRDAGFRWLQEEGVWAKQIDRDKGWQTRADAETLFERVAAMIRAEQGVSHELA
jgi:hypothetical protein